MIMTPRQAAILRAVIHEYVTTALPVGSKVLVEKYQLGISPATVRNAMAELEEAGFLMHPHTSAGRVPTDKGYRYYVDSLREERHLSLDEQARIRLHYERVNHEIEDMLQETTRIMSSLTGLASLVVAPSLDNCVLRCMEMVPLSTSKVLMVLVTSAGMVENRVIDVPVFFDALELRNACTFINEKLRGLRLAVVRQCLLEEKYDRVSRYGRFFDEVYTLVQHVLDTKSHERIFLEGVSNIVSLPEFQDIDLLRRLIKVLEDSSKPLPSSEDMGDAAVKVTIGAENDVDALLPCSVISARYFIDDGLSGSISIVGPTRMNYDDVIDKVRFMADNLNIIMRNIGRQ